MLRCARCVIPDTRPDTEFVDGVCSACLSFEKRPQIDWRARREELEALLARHGNRCIVPSSGGKDSTYQVLTLLELGAKPVVATATTCMLTPTGRRNIENLARFAPTVEVTPNLTVRAKLNRLGLKLVGDISWPEHVAIFTIPFGLACDFRIPLIIYGENPQAQYGGPPGADEARVMTRRWVSEFGGFLGLRPRDLVDQGEVTADDMKLYMPPTEEQLEEAGVEAHFLGQYIEWDSARNAEVAIAHGLEARLPSQANWWPAENLDNAMTGIHDFFCFLKYGYGRAAAQLSVDIRSGRISRDEALQVLSERDGLFPLKYMGVPIGRVLQRLSMSSDEFVEVCNAFMNKDLFADESVRWGERVALEEFAHG